MKLSIDTFLRRVLTGGVTAIIVFIPFHAFLTVWVSSAVGHYTALRLWKEVLLVLLVLASGMVVSRASQPILTLLQYKTIRLLSICIGVYVLLTLLVGIIGLASDTVTLKALGYGYISNLRYLIFFIVCLVAAIYYREFWVRYWKQLLLYPAVIVLGVGLFQLLVLPPDVLRHFGYGPETIAPYIAVDQKVEFARAQSTLRGPNPLGAYMVIVVVAMVALYAQTRHYLAKFGILVSLVVLFGTYSRSAWIGTAVALVGLGMLMLGTKARKLFIGVIALIVSLGVFGVVLFRDNNTVQNIFFHTDETSQASRSSNEDRANAITGGLGDVVREPLGRGVGTAGPASAYNDGDARISENYFIQIGQEIGFAGLVLFMAMCGFIAKVLWDMRHMSILSVILITSFTGLVFVNVLSHAWADDTLAYMWWGFAGIVIGMSYVSAKKTQVM